MFRSIRFMIGLGVICATGVGLVVCWFTGVFDPVVAYIHRLTSEPLTLPSLLPALGSGVIALLFILVLVLALSDN